MSTSYGLVVSYTFKAVVSTNAGPLHLAEDEGWKLVNRLDKAFPGADFMFVKLNDIHSTTAIKMGWMVTLYLDDTGLVSWEELSFTGWLQRAADPAYLSWLPSRAGVNHHG